MKPQLFNKGKIQKKKKKQALPEMKSKPQSPRKSTFKEKFNERHY